MENFSACAGDLVKPVRHPIIHLAIDVQKHYVSSLSADRTENYCKQIDKFRHDLRERDIPTIHVGFQGSNRPIEFLSRTAEWRMPKPEPREESRQISDLAFLMKPYKDEDIVVKHCADAFATLASSPAPGLAGILKQYKVQTIIMTGGYTMGCVWSSAMSAIEQGFNLILAYDRLTDECSVPVEQERNPLWHKKQLERSLSLSSAKLLTAEECLDFVAAQGKRPIMQSSKRCLLERNV